MLRLVVMRHGEAATEMGFNDKNRQLTDCGKQQVHDVASSLLGKAWIPELALVSDATRTQETFAMVLNVFGTSIPARLIPKFYLGRPEDALLELAECQESTILIVGHNPGWSELVTSLAGRFVTLSTADAALLTCEETDWATAINSPWTCTEIIKSLQL